MNPQINVLQLVGKRVLINEKQGYREAVITEVKVLELSPSNLWVKLMNPHGRKYWVSIQNVSVVEVLKDLTTGRPSEDE